MAGILSLLLSFSLVIAVHSLGPVPRALQWSSKTYGPDGPWHAISLQIGTPAQNIDLFPGGFWQSDILSSSICDNGPQPCYASSAGLFDTAKSGTQFTISETGGIDNSTFEDKGMLSLFGSGTYTFDSMAITTVDPPSAKALFENFDMLVIEDGQMTLPNGSIYHIEVGNLALGAPNVNQSWNSGGRLFNSSLVPSSLYLQGQTPSNSFGMHIGSAAIPISPSLYIGGYDQSRVLGNVSVQDYNMHYFSIDLLDIGIGVAEGLSPFNFTSKKGLLTQGNSSIGVAMQVIVEPTAPYLYLPKSTCDAITQNLPVIYNSDLGLYFWDTTSSDYKTIITSPSYLSFTFRLNASISETTTIKVPFSLLNLTLTSPLVASLTPYFPCTPFDYGKSYGLPTLGRAFLQAAFLGVNWGLEGDGVWFLAQAPGPNTPSQPVAKSIGLDEHFILPSSNDWAETWKESWTLIEDSSSGGKENSSSITPNTPDSPKHASKLSGGIIAAIAVGVVLGLAIIGVGIWFFMRKRRAANVHKDEQPSWGGTELDTTEKRRWELGTQGKQRVEMSSEPRKAELDAYRPPRELPG